MHRPRGLTLLEGSVSTVAGGGYPWKPKKIFKITLRPSKKSNQSIKAYIP